VDLLEANLFKLDASDCFKKIEILAPRIVVIDFLLRTWEYSFEIISRMKKTSVFKNSKLIFFGHAIGNFDGQIFEIADRLDYIVAKYEYSAVAQLVLSILKGEDLASIPYIVFRNGTNTASCHTSRISKMESAQKIDRSYIESLAPQENVEILTSCGCDNKCTFCNINDIRFCNRDAWHGFSSESVVDEIESIVSEYGRRTFQFIDHNFVGNKNVGMMRSEKIAEEIIARKLDIRFNFFCRIDSIEETLFSKLKDAGLFCVNVGVESLSGKLLRRYDKNINVDDIYKATEILKKLNIIINPSFIIFDPVSTIADIELTFRYIEKYELFFSLSPTEILPIKNTSLYETLKNENLLHDEGQMLDNFIPQVIYRDKRVKSLKRNWTEFKHHVAEGFPSLQERVAQTIDLWFNGHLADGEKRLYACRKYKEAEFYTVRKMMDNITAETDCSSTYDMRKIEDIYTHVQSI
jgi:radical SAM superfamily enzyme YgiQ (UPF0313 family)